MNQSEDRNTRDFKAKEAAFYSDCQIYTSQIEECLKTEDNPYTKESDRTEARNKREKLENEQQMLIDKWKEEHGEYDYEKARYTRIDGSKIASRCYGNYCVALENQAKDDEEEYDM